MPIRVDYTPPLNRLSNAAYIAGLGEYQQRQQSVNQRQQQLDMQRARMAQQQDMDRIQMMRALGNDQFQRQQAADLSAYRQQQMDLREQQLLNDMKDEDIRRQQAAKRNELYQQQLEAQDPARAAQLRWSEESAELMDEFAAEIEKTSSQMKLNEDGQKKRLSLMNTLRAIKAQRHSLSPQQYARKMEEWTNEYNKTDLPGYEIPEVSVEEQFNKEAYQIPGTTGVATRDKDGNIKVSKVDREPVDVVRRLPSGQVEAVPSGEYFSANPDIRRKMMDTARKQLIEERKPVGGAEVGASQSISYPTPQEIAQRARELYEAEQILSGVSSQPPEGQPSRNPDTGRFETREQAEQREKTQSAKRMRYNPTTGQLEPVS